jgi:hypothetical protein
MLAILCKTQDKHRKEDQKSPLSMTRPMPTALPSALPSMPPQYQKCPNGCFRLLQEMAGRGPNLSINIKGYYASTRPYSFLIKKKKNNVFWLKTLRLKMTTIYNKPQYCDT